MNLRALAVVMLLVILGWQLKAREFVPPDDGPEQQEQEAEEVMPDLPANVPPQTPLNPKWVATDFTKQDQALGWSPDIFAVPMAMTDRVQFWVDIYTKYTSDQGLLHDSKYINLVYEKVDFTDITAHADWSPRQREKARRKRVNDLKKEIAVRFKRLQSLKSGDDLTGEDRRYWDLFSKVDEPKKFLEAARRGRLRFQLGQRNQFIAGIYQSGRYLHQIEDIFRSEGLPIELTRLPFVESSFNLHARSKVGASGLWQFMRSAARQYMRMDNSADERNDPLRASHAAARKMRENYLLLKTWPLAITAYNRGPTGVKKLSEKMGTTDLIDLLDVRKGRFGFASANFYASFLAALVVERHADQFFGPLEVLPELRGAEIQITRNQTSKELLKWFNNDLDLAQLLNPHVSEAVWRGQATLSRKHILRVPLMQETEARGALGE